MNTAGFAVIAVFLVAMTGSPPSDGSRREPPTPSRLLQLLREGRIEEAITAIRQRQDVNVPDELGATPLHIAASMGAASVVSELLSAGATVDAVAPDGSTPLLRAARAGRLQVASQLIAGGANVNARDFVGNTPLIGAASARSIGVVQLLLEHGADPAMRSDNGLTALDAARRRRYTIRLPWTSTYWVFGWKSWQDEVVIALQRALPS